MSRPPTPGKLQVATGFLRHFDTYSNLEAIASQRRSMEPLVNTLLSNCCILACISLSGSSLFLKQRMIFRERSTNFIWKCIT